MPAIIFVFAGMARSYRFFGLFADSTLQEMVIAIRLHERTTFKLKVDGSGVRPVLNFQSRHSLELALVVGDEYPSLGFGMGSDP